MDDSPFDIISRINFPKPERHRCGACGMRRLCIPAHNITVHGWVCEPCERLGLDLTPYQLYLFHRFQQAKGARDGGEQEQEPSDEGREPDAGP